jgi:CheY-like chemotaxis protein
MKLAADIAPHLPYLRRFSRALTGGQSSGDSYVVALLETLIADPGQFDPEPTVRVAIYRSFCQLWQSISLNLRKSSDNLTWEDVAQSQLANITPKAREAFLLGAVEGFTVAETAIILGNTVVETQMLLEEASDSILHQVATDVMIIEDEPIIAMDLEAVLESLGHKVTGIARTEKEAIQLAASQKPGLVLADIQLADGSSGIDAVKNILQNITVPVIFITAFPERLLTGENPEPTFLITKPFMPEMVKAVVSQALFFNGKTGATA